MMSFMPSMPLYGFLSACLAFAVAMGGGCIGRQV